MSSVKQQGARLCLPVEKWPAGDQDAWVKACTPASFMDDHDGGELAHLAPASRTRYAMGYGRWIKFLTLHAPACLDLIPSERCSKENIRAYMDVMRSAGNSDRTILCRLEELAVVVGAFDPNFDRRFLNGHVSILKAKVTPVRNKSHIKTAEQLAELGFRLMEAASDPGNIQHALSYRDGLIIAFLAYHPVRRRNLINFHLDRNLLKHGSGYLVIFAASETKNGVPCEVPLADVLVEPMNRYLEEWRPALMKRVTKNSREVGTSVWVTSQGSPMSPNAVSGCIELRTKEAFGKAISPHGFRDASATLVAINDPRHARIAAPLLGHRSLQTTETFYIRATSLDSQRSYLDVLRDYKKDGRK